MTVQINLPASKSESNRALILAALSAYQNELPFSQESIKNISQAADTQILLSILSHQDAEIWDAKDAGTTFRFLAAFAVATKKNVILTGSARMKERPIAVLVEALRSIGAKIHYLEKQGFPPLQIFGKDFIQTKNEIDIRADVSSQYISALLMIAPVLDKGLKMNLVGRIGSRPYIEMTLQQISRRLPQMRVAFSDIIEIAHSRYNADIFEVENDWSAVSYVYAFVALSASAEVFVAGLKQDSLQGDKAIVEIMQHFGVETVWKKEGIILRKKQNFIPIQQNLHIDFSDIPDLAQTIVVVAAATGMSVYFRGLESLRIKETDRIAALQTELLKFGVHFCEIDADTFTLFGTFIPVKTEIVTYKDHRMAMAFAPLWLKSSDLIFENPEVVSKSFPTFWKEVEKLRNMN